MLEQFDDLLKNSLLFRGAYAFLCGLIVFSIVYWLDKRGQKNGLSDNESIDD